MNQEPGAASGFERLTIRETADGLGALVPARRNIMLVGFLLLWLCGWAAGEWFALSEIFDAHFVVSDVFLAVWGAVWTLGGLGVAIVILRQFTGSERLFITGGAVVLESPFVLRRRRQVWAPGEATAFRRAPVGTYSGGVTPDRGIAFEAGGYTRYFGSGLSSLEIGALLAAIARHLPEADGAEAQQADAASPDAQ